MALELPTNLPKWAVPAGIGGALGLLYLFSKRQNPTQPVTQNNPAPSTTPVYLPSGASDSGGGASQDNGSLLNDLTTRYSDLLAQAQAAAQSQNAALTDQLQQQAAATAAQIAALQQANDKQIQTLQGTIQDLIKKYNQPGQTFTGSMGPPPTPPPSSATPQTGGGSSPVSPIVAPAPTGRATGPDWAALARYLYGKNFSPGGTHFPGEAVQIVWTQAPYNSPGGAPPSGVYPTAILPVKFNGDHSGARYATIGGFESAFVRTLRWTAEYMEGNASADSRAVWDQQLGRLMRDIGPYVGHEDEWLQAGFDLGSVVASPFQTGAG